MSPFIRRIIGPRAPAALGALLCLTLLAVCTSPDEPVNGDNQANANDDTNQSNNDESSSICTAGDTRCDGPNEVATCAEDEQSWEGQSCDTGQACNDDMGACTAQICRPAEFDGCTDDGDHRHCNATGTAYVDGSCPGDSSCSDGVCGQQECQPGTTTCGGDGTILTCSEAGVFVASDICPTGTGCFDSQCEELCEISTKVSSYIGCEYWSIDLDNYQDALSEPHAIIVTNHNQDLAANVELFEGRSNRRILNSADGSTFDTTIPPGEARVYLVPPGFVHSGTATFVDQAIRITSSIPVIAHQFNPLNNVGVFSNDGSLLLPTNSVGTEYWGMSWVNRGDQVQLRGYLTLVNSSPSSTQVTVRPSAQVVAGAQISRIEAGEERIFDLAPGQSLNLVASGVELADAQSHGCLADPEGNPDSVTPCPDLTGTHIQSEQPITVFGGHQCANVLLGVDRCDHIETLLMPVDTWGYEYVGSKFEPRAEGSIPEPDIWRVMAAEDNTRIQTDPPIDGVHNTFLDAGEWKQFAARQNFELAGDKPIQLVQYMVGANWTGIPRICDEGIDFYNPTGIGDPSMAMAVPADQFRTDYIVHTPEQYTLDYLNVIVPVGQDVAIDGETIPASQWELVGELNRYEVATLEVEPGFHTLTGDVAFGVVGYGYDCHVSYAYPGGMNLEPIDGD